MFGMNNQFLITELQKIATEKVVENALDTLGLANELRSQKEQPASDNSAPTETRSYFLDEAGQTKIRKAYRNLARQCHPDKALDENEKKIREGEFKAIQKTYEILTKELERNKEATEYRRQHTAAIFVEYNTRRRPATHSRMPFSSDNHFSFDTTGAGGFASSRFFNQTPPYSQPKPKKTNYEFIMSASLKTLPASNISISFDNEAQFAQKLKMACFFHDFSSIVTFKSFAANGIAADMPDTFQNILVDYLETFRNLRKVKDLSGKQIIKNPAIQERLKQHLNKNKQSHIQQKGPIEFEFKLSTLKNDEVKKRIKANTIEELKKELAFLETAQYEQITLVSTRRGRWGIFKTKYLSPIAKALRKNPYFVAFREERFHLYFKHRDSIESKARENLKRAQETPFAVTFQVDEYVEPYPKEPAATSQMTLTAPTVGKLLKKLGDELSLRSCERIQVIEVTQVGHDKPQSKFIQAIQDFLSSHQTMRVFDDHANCFNAEQLNKINETANSNSKNNLIRVRYCYSKENKSQSLRTFTVDSFASLRKQVADLKELDYDTIEILEIKSFCQERTKCQKDEQRCMNVIIDAIVQNKQVTKFTIDEFKNSVIFDFDNSERIRKHVNNNLRTKNAYRILSRLSHAMHAISVILLGAIVTALPLYYFTAMPTLMIAASSLLSGLCLQSMRWAREAYYRRTANRYYNSSEKIDHLPADELDSLRNGVLATSWPTYLLNAVKQKSVWHPEAFGAGLVIGADEQYHELADHIKKPKVK